jgi:hypothetical protein
MDKIGFLDTIEDIKANEKLRKPIEQFEADLYD